MTRRGSTGLVWLGIEAGATRTVALADGAVTLRREFGPANLRLLDDRQLERHFRHIAKSMPPPDALAIGMAGARTDGDRERIRRAAAMAWPGVACHATHDLDTALMAGASASRVSGATFQVLILSGTGSCCFGRSANGRKTVKVGGWGHILGDKGSGYEIGLRALKAVVFYFDRDGRWPVLGQRLLRALQLNAPNDLIGWAQSAAKDAIAALAVEVFAAWADRDCVAADILDGAAASLAKDAAACAARLGAGRARFILAGSVLLKQPRFAAKVSRELKKRWRGAEVTPLRRESVWGAVELAKRQLSLPRPKTTGAAADSMGSLGRSKNSGAPSPPLRDGKRESEGREGRRFGGATPEGAWGTLSPTEQRHPDSMSLDRLPLGKAIALMLREDAKIPGALLAERARIQQGVQLIVRSLRRGGRLFYVGAGTSGRLGVLDASECPPTFRTDPAMVQGIIAGGQTALWSAVEGAEDDAAAGGVAMAFRGVGRRDTVVGIAASGRTPFVWGALREAKRRGAGTVLLCFNPNLDIPRADQPTLLIVPRIGPEVLTGSTRLKAGTATKLVLNIFTTLAMVRLGKVRSNLMVDVKASNVKLRDRAVRIVRELTGADSESAQAALKQADWKIPEACARLTRRS